MERVIRSVFVLFLLGFFTVASAQLPPEILADKHLIHAEQLYAAKDYAEAFNVMEKIIALQKEHSLTLSDEFHFQYAQVALAVDSTRIALESVSKYLSATGKEGEFYKEALALLLKAEGNEVMTVEDFYNDVIKTQGTCEGLPEGSKCWMALTNHPECYVWNESLAEGETATWTGQCSGHLPDGKGTFTWYLLKEKVKRKYYERTGLLQNGKEQGDWVEKNYYATATDREYAGRAWREREVSYVDGKKHGEWVEIHSNPNSKSDGYGNFSWDGTFDKTESKVSYVDDKKHGKWTERYWKIRDQGVPIVLSEGAYVDDKKQGRWVSRAANGFYTSESYYVDDKAHGHWVTRYRDGTTEETTYVDGKAHETVIRFSDGIVGGGSYDVDGKRHGEWTEGYQAREKEQGRYVNGKREGTWLNYEDGKCRSRIYKDDDWIRDKDGNLSRRVDEKRCREAGLIP